MDLSQDYDSLYDSRGRANLGEASSGKISGKMWGRGPRSLPDHIDANERQS